MSTFSKLLELQANLVTELFEAEKIDWHPHEITLSDPEPPKQFLLFLKGITADAIEETYELSQSYSELSLVMVNIPEYGAASSISINNHLEDIGQEAADILHFLLEICLFADYDAASLHLALYEEAIIWDVRVGDASEDELKTLLSLATFHNAKDSMISPNYMSLLDLRSDIQIRDNNRIGSKISAQVIEVIRERYLELLEDLISLRRVFAAKQWKEKMEAPAMLTTHKQISKVLLSYCKLIHLLGGNSDALVYQYIKKNTENLTRIKNKY